METKLIRKTKRERTCCFTGHRDISWQDKQIIIERLETAILKLIGEGVVYFGAGGALGFDTLAAQSVLRLRKQFPHIKLILVLPCPTQAEKWGDLDQQIYEDIKRQADKVVYTSDWYTSGCMHKRNRHLVDNSSVCICYLTKQHGGTAYTVDYARKQNIAIINVAVLE